MSKARDRPPRNKRFADANASARDAMAPEHDDKLYRLLAEGSTDFIYVIGPDFRVKYVNRSGAWALKTTPDGARGKRLEELFPPDTVATMTDWLSRVFESGKPFSGEFVHQFNRENFYTHVLLTPFFNEEGKVDAVMGITRDINDLKNAGLALQESEEKYRSLIENINDMVWETDVEGKCVYASPKTRDVLGYVPEEILGRTAYDFIVPGDAGRVREFFGQYKARREPLPLIEYRVVRKDGTLAVIETNGVPVFDREGRFKGYRGVNRDITERKRAENAVRESEEKYRGLVEEISDWICEVDRRFICTYSSPRAKEVLGYEIGEIIGRSAFDFLPPDDANRIKAMISRADEAGSEYSFFECSLLRKDGRAIRVEVSGKAVRDSEGGFKCYRATLKDITQRKQAEEALKSSEALFRTLFENASTAIIIVDSDTGAVLDSNRNAEQLFGRTRDEMSGMIVTRLHPPGHADDRYSHIARQARQGRIVNSEAEILHKDGRRIPVIINITPMHINGKTVVMGFFLDITDRRQAEDALRESEEKFRLLTETSPTAIFIYQGDRFVYMNPATESITGYSHEELMEMSPWEIVHPDYREKVKELASRRMKGLYHPTSYETKLLTRDGREKWMNNSSASIVYKNRPAGLIVAFDITDRKQAEDALRESEERLRLCAATARFGTFDWDIVHDRHFWSPETYEIYGIPQGTPLTLDYLNSLIYPGDRQDDVVAAGLDPEGPGEYAMEYRIRRASDGEVRWVYVRTRVLFAGEGAGRRAVRILGAIQDITEQKEAEEMLANAKEQVELYLDLMGHDINNMNMIAGGFLELARQALNDDGRLERTNIDLLDRAMAAINHSSALISNVRKLQRGRSGEYKRETYDLGALIEEVCGEYRSVPDRDVSISCDTVKGVQVQANELLRDVFVNLIDNAIKHSSGPVFISIRMAPVRRNGRQYCTVTVEDNGPGVPDRMKDAVFDRLRRGDTLSKGNGLGLYLVRSLVESYGGTVRVEDRETGDYTKGARFVVELPAMDVVIPEKP
ncbi:MAG: putative diguanylate cyclase [Methanocella sp. PtaU1.Bin125]|nr:MAG: putative diguanylate cyclase [Methanocella sp. PtaU1.Bin125]